MHVAITGPVASADLAQIVGTRACDMPIGYSGAPLMATLAREFLTMGHRLTIVSTDSNLPLRAEGVRRYEFDSLTVVFCPCRPRAWRPNGLRPGRIVDLFAFERVLLCDELLRSDADVVHAHWAYEFGVAALASGLPVVLSLHDSPATILRHTRSPYRALRWLMARRAMRTATHLTAPSPYLAHALQASCRAPIAVVPNPVSHEVIELGRRRQRPTTRRIAMVCNGWDRIKNPEVALEAFARFRRAQPEAELHLFGHDFEADGYGQRWAFTRGLLGGCHFHGPTAHGRMIGQLARMDVLLHTSREESFGVAIAEAMSLGLNVVAGSCSGAVPWVTGADDGNGASAPAGILVDIESADAVAEGLARAFDETYPLRSATGLARVVNSFSPTAVASAYLAAYRNAVGLR